MRGSLGGDVFLTVQTGSIFFKQCGPVTYGSCLSLGGHGGARRVA